MGAALGAAGGQKSVLWGPQQPTRWVPRPSNVPDLNLLTSQTPMGCAPELHPLAAPLVATNNMAGEIWLGLTMYRWRGDWAYNPWMLGV